MILVLFDETQGESDVNKDNPLDNFQANVKISSYKKESSHRLSWDSHFEDIVLKYLIIKEREIFSVFPMHDCYSDTLRAQENTEFHFVPKVSASCGQGRLREVRFDKNKPCPHYLEHNI